MSELDLPTTLHLPKLPIYLERLQKELEKIVKSGNPHMDPILMRLVSSGGKRLRPSLLFAVASSQTKKIDSATIKAGAAIELVHLASLVHDDIMDNAKTRWGEPTVNSKQGVGEAIVIGDFLLAKACQSAADIGAEAAALISSTIAQLCDGQSRELGDGSNLDRSLDSLLLAVKGKTAALFAAACQLGALSANYPTAQVNAFKLYGINLGTSFQLVDDLLDLLSTNKLAGKPVGTDASSGIYTMPVLLTLHSNARDTLMDMLRSEAIDPPALTKLLINNGSIDKSLQKIVEFNQSAASALKNLPASSIIVGLQQLPERYLMWVLSNQLQPRYKSAITPLVK